MPNNLSEADIEKLTETYKKEVLEINKKIKNLSRVPHRLRYVFAGVATVFSIVSMCLVFLSFLPVAIATGATAFAMIMSSIVCNKIATNINLKEYGLLNQRDILWYEYLNNFESIMQANKALLGPTLKGNRNLTHLDVETKKQGKKDTNKHNSEEQEDNVSL